MPRFLFARALIALILLLTLAGPGLASPSADSETNLTGLFPDYDIQTIDNAGNAGAYPSIAIDPANDLPYISYYDQTNGDLRLAQAVGSGGNCGHNNSWLCQTVPVPDSAGTNLGMNSSIDIFRPSTLSPLISKLGIAFTDATGKLRLAEYRDYFQNSQDGWYFTIISDPFFPTSIREISFKYSPDGYAHVAYHYRINTLLNIQEGLSHAVYKGSGGNCGQDPNDTTIFRWQCSTIESGGEGSGIGKSASIGFVGNNQPVIAFHNASTNRLYTATDMNGQPWNCGPSNTWSCRMIDAQGGASASIWVNPANGNDVRIAYYDPVTGNLEYAYYSPADANCGLNNVPQYEYKCITIEGMATGLAAPRVSLSVGPADESLIAYQYVPTDPQARPSLKVARTDWFVLFKNCGPETGLPPLVFKTWSCSALDNGDAYLEEGYHVSAAFNKSGLAAVAYSELNTHDDEYNLKLVQEVMRAYTPLIRR